VLVTIESFSAKYMGSNGDGRDLTPNLDALRKQSLYFNNFYATGTRTDRGLEAITLAIPPTPGRSIVKRIGRESGFASLGQQLSAIGYDSVFVYGGRGYFDNMNAFSAATVIASSTRAASRDGNPLKNAWGMADEDLYKQTLKLADADYAKQQPFLLQLMTTSNHRPYTYPDGRIDIKSGNGRDGAVKYTDTPSASSEAGTAETLVRQYDLHVRRRPHRRQRRQGRLADHQLSDSAVHLCAQDRSPENAQLASQIDLAPTLLGLLNLATSRRSLAATCCRTTRCHRAWWSATISTWACSTARTWRFSATPGPARHDQALGESRELQVAVMTLDPPGHHLLPTASYGFKQQLLGWRAPKERPRS
jgi:phosphoglycerol transferase MdoB-like AlkP superfamily enzyme